MILQKYLDHMLKWGNTFTGCGPLTVQACLMLGVLYISCIWNTFLNIVQREHFVSHATAPLDVNTKEEFSFSQQPVLPVCLFFFSFPEKAQTQYCVCSGDLYTSLSLAAVSDFS